MNFNSDFKYDLKLGNKGENLLYNIIKLKGQTIEVKTDRDAIKNKCTGNVFVEYMSRDKLSGISTTQAKWWAFVISNEQIILIETNKLKKLCKLKTLKRVSGGDNNTSKGILLPIKYLTT